MNNNQKQIYMNLRNCFDKLIDYVLGPDYYTINSSIDSSDIEAYEDMKKYFHKIKYELKIYKRLFYCMIIITLILGIYLIIY